MVIVSPEGSLFWPPCTVFPCSVLLHATLSGELEPVGLSLIELAALCGTTASHRIMASSGRPPGITVDRLAIGPVSAQWAKSQNLLVQ